MSKIKFERPTSVQSAVSLLASREGSRCIAGGQTLVAMMNAGLVEAPVLIAISGITELGTISKQAAGTIRIGATVCHRDVSCSHILEGGNAVVREAARVIAHSAIRNFGTIGGALAHADPAADYPTAVTAVGAHIEIAGSGGRRAVPAEEFFLDYFTTVLESGEMVTAILLPASNKGSSGHYYKFSLVDGDYAIASIGVTVHTEGGVCTAARIALGGCGPTPVFDAMANDKLVGTKCDGENIAAAAKILVDRTDPVDDVRASADYRRALIPKILHRAVRHAWSQAIGA